MGRFKSRTVVITGAASGIGRATALAFAAEGSDLGLVDANRPGLEQVAHEIEAAGHKVRISHLALTGEASVKAAIQQLTFKRVHVLVNNAGIDVAATMEHTSEEDLDRLFAVNLKVPFFLCKHVVPLMARVGEAAIVNVASAAGLVPISGRPAYNASKGALIAFSRSIALDLAPLIRVNCVCPGAIDTPLLRSSVDAADSPVDALAAVVARYPLNRLGDAADIACAILFLASSESRYITGVAFAVDGGRTLH